MQLKGIEHNSESESSDDDLDEEYHNSEIGGSSESEDDIEVRNQKVKSKRKKI